VTRFATTCATFVKCGVSCDNLACLATICFFTQSGGFSGAMIRESGSRVLRLSVWESRSNSFKNVRTRSNSFKLVQSSRVHHHLSNVRYDTHVPQTRSQPFERVDSDTDTSDRTCLGPRRGATSDLLRSLATLEHYERSSAFPCDA
jgi:hypothetical protein